MDIAFLLPDLGYGGVARSMLHLGRELIARGHRVDFVLFRNIIRCYDEVPRDAGLFTWKNRPDKHAKEDAADVLARLVQLPIRSRPLDWLRMASALRWDPFCLIDPPLLHQARAVASYMDLVKPDCVLPSLSRAKAAAILACRFLTEHPPVVPIVHSFVSRYRHTRRYRHLAGDAAHFVAVSDSVSECLSAIIGIPRNGITTIYNPVVDSALELKMAEPPDHPWLVDDGAPVILSAGRLARLKDYPTLIKAFSHLTARRPCRLIILGEGRMRNRIENLIRDLNLVDRVSLPGWVENPFMYMSRASLFVMSSRHEGLPGVLVEALACGCPCVSTDCPSGPAEILRNGQIGPLVPMGDEFALAEAMERTLTRPPDADVLRKRAADFSANAAVRAYEKLISTIVGQTTPPGSASTHPDLRERPRVANDAGVREARKQALKGTGCISA